MTDLKISDLSPRKIRELDRDEATAMIEMIRTVLGAFVVASDYVGPRWWSAKQEAHLYKSLSLLEDRLRDLS